jgi:LysM repeat protein
VFVRGSAVVLACLCLATEAASAGTSYRVRPGDSLTAIASAHGTSVATLVRLNRLSPDGVLLAGSTLQLPGPAFGGRYLVQPGDSLSALAQRFGCSVTALARANGMHLSQALLIGTTLRVPLAAAAAPSARSAPTTTYVVRPGDSLSSIAMSHGVSLGALADLNRLSLGDILLAGRRLVLPANSVATSPRSSVRDSLAFWSSHYGVDVHLATALAWMESGFNNAMVSTTGAVGVMQIMPDTWDYVEQVLLLGRSVPHTADGNVRIGVAFLHHLLHVYGGDERRALAAYYQGARALADAGFLPGTEQYVEDILALKTRF